MTLLRLLAIAGLLTLLVRTEPQGDYSSYDSGDPLSNLVALVRGEIPVAKAVVGVRERAISVNGVSNTDPLFFEVSRQPSTWYDRALWKADGETPKFRNTSKGCVWGANSTSKWKIEDSVLYTSRITDPALAEPDPVAREVDGQHQHMTSGPLLLGLTPNSEIEILTSGNGLRMKDAFGKEIIADVVMSNALVHSISWLVTHEQVEGTVTVTYTYKPGKRPRWLPATIHTAVSEVHPHDGKRLSYTDTEHIRSCELGTRNLPSGYLPAMFLPKGGPKRVIAWTNGVGFVTENGKTHPIQPFAPRRFPKSDASEGDSSAPHP